MEGKTQVLGVDIDNISVQEAMERVEKFMETDSLSTIGIMTISSLLEAAESEGYREQIRQLDLSLIGDVEIMKAVGIQEAKRCKEIEENWFLRRFIKYLIDQGKTLAFICEKELEREETLKYFKENYPRLQIVGSFVPDDGKEDVDGLVNLINGESPDVIFAVLPQSMQEKFITQNRSKILAKVWLGVGKSLSIENSISLKPDFWERVLDKHKWRKTLSKFHKDKGEV